MLVMPAQCGVRSGTLGPCQQFGTCGADPSHVWRHRLPSRGSALHAHGAGLMLCS